MVTKGYIDNRLVFNGEFATLMDILQYPVFCYMYDSKYNCLVDERGFPFFGMYEHMQPWEYQRYKHTGGVIYFQKNDKVYEYIFPEVVSCDVSTSL